MEQYNSIQQILKKENGHDRKPIYPSTVIQAVFDAKTGASLEAILAQFNSIYVQYQGTPEATRNIIPVEMRRAGLMITYMNMDSETITEKASSAVQKDNDHWGLDVNWSRVDELSLSGDIAVSANGTWIINGVDTKVAARGSKGDAGLTPWLKTIDNKLHYSYDNTTWEPCSDYLASYFRFNATSSDSQAGTIGKIQISKDNKTWQDLSPEFRNYLRIQGYVSSISALPKNQVVGTIYGVNEGTNTYSLHVWDGSTWVNNGTFTSIAAGVVQETGDSETEVMSQKAVTEKLSELGSEVGLIIQETELLSSLVKNNGYYDLLSEEIVDNPYYFYSEIPLSNDVLFVEMRFEKSTIGGLGVEFRDSNGTKTGSYSNTTQPRGTKIKISVPVGSASMIFSYLNEKGLSIENASDVPFDGVTTYVYINNLANRLTNVEDKLNVGSFALFDIIKYNGFYNLLSEEIVDNPYYFYSEIPLSNDVLFVEMRFEKSTIGGLGVEFRDSNGTKTGSYSNTTQPRGTKIKISVPVGSASMIFSYLNEKGLSIENASDVPFDGVTIFSSEYNIKNKLDRIENIINENKLADFYLSEDTGNVLQDNLTLEELYDGYDELCLLYPDYIKRIEDIGVDSSGLEIRQYRVGYNKQFYQIGEGSYPEKNAENLWDDSVLAYNKILVNAGTHGDEKAPCYATMLAFRDLLKSGDSWAMHIKSDATIYVCPTLNPYGFQHRTLANYNNVNINRDIADQTQPESIAWKSWVDKHLDMIAYIDIHGVDYFTPFFEFSKNDSEINIRTYAEIVFKLSSDLKKNWDNTFDVKGWTRPYLLKSEYGGVTFDYTASKGIKGFVIETPCDVVANQYNEAPNYFKSYSKSNKMTKDMLLNTITFFINKNKI